MRISSTRRVARASIAFIIIFLTLLGSIEGANTPCIGCNVTVSPGKSDLRLGDDFPVFAAVKLSYLNSTVLTNSSGDLLFSVTLTATLPNGTVSNRAINGAPQSVFYNSIDIYIPPDFTGLAIDKFWTSFTNNYDHNSLGVSKVVSSDRIAPGWWEISVRNLVVTADATLFETNSSLVAQRIFFANKTQYMRVFFAGSPVIAGRYFFKVFINGTSVGSANFPTLVVKGSRDPAYISGTVRDAGNNDSSLAGMPIKLLPGTGARILATGYDSSGRAVAAQAFINSTANGQYTLFGVAPGTYNITAYAAGFVPTQRPFTVTVHPTQSLDGIDILLPHSVVIAVTALSVDCEGNPTPWGSDYNFNGIAIPRSIVIDVLDLSGAIKASTPFPYRPSLFTNPTDTSFDFTILWEVGWDGRIPQDYANYTSGLIAGDYLLTASVSQHIQPDETRIHVNNQTDDVRHATIRLILSGIFTLTIHFRDSTDLLEDQPIPVPATLTVQVFDVDGSLRGSNTTFVPVNSISAFLEVIGSSQARGFGNIALLSPNSGLLPGVYHIVAKLSSSPTITGNANVGIRQLYYQLSDYTGTIGCGDTQLSFPIFKGGGISLHLYSVDTETPYLLVPWAYGGAPITLKIIDSYGNVYQANSTQPRLNATQLENNATYRTIFAYNATFFYSGLQSGTYTVVVQTVGYTQPTFLHIAVRLGADSDASIWLVLGPRINLNLVFETENILAAINSNATFAQPINNIDGTPIRFEIFDANDGTFVGANVTYIPNFIPSKTGQLPETSFSITLVGFRQYSGDPWLIWSGFYDTADAAQQNDGGLVQGDYILRVWVDGYYAKGLIPVHLPKRGGVSLIDSMDRASRIRGTVVGLDFYTESRPLSWAIIDVEPAAGALNFTTTSLDGDYQLWVPGGNYQIGISLPGYYSYGASLYVPSGSDMIVDVILNG